MSPAARGWRAFGRVIAVALSAAPAVGLAQAPPPQPSTPPPQTAPFDPGESTVVAGIEVIGRPPGPPIWKVSQGASQVIILGAVTPIPHLLQWDTRRVERALDGAGALLLPPRPKIGLFEGVGLIFNNGALHLPRGASLDRVLAPADRDRFLAIAAQIHQKPDRYAHWKPALAGVALLEDFQRAAGLSALKPGTTVQKLAEAKHVPVRYAAEIRAVPLIRSLGRMSSAANQVCFEAAVSEIDRESAHARAVADAWAKGDLKAVRANYSISPLQSCVDGAPSLRDALEQGTAGSVRAIEDALKRPGKTVAVIDLNFLLRANGVLDRLKADGATISAPME